MNQKGKRQTVKELVCRHKKALLLGGLCLILAVSVVPRYLSKKQTAVPVTAARVQVTRARYDANFSAGLETTTSLRANADVILKSKVDTYVKKIYLAKGRTFRAGDLLVELEHGSQSAQVQAAKAQISMNQAAASSARSTLKNAASDQERYDILIAKGYATRQEVENKRTSASTAGSDYEKAVSNIAYAKAQLDAAESTLNDYYFKAPFKGLVLDDYNICEGSKVAPETSILRIADIEVLKASINIPEQQLQNIKEGMTASLTCDSLPGQKFTGTVKNVNAFVDTDTHTVQADVYLDNAAYDYVLKPGMFARVFVVEQTEAPTLVVPSGAIRKDNTVLVAREHKTVVVKITPGLTYNKQTAVTGALQDGDLIIVSGGSTLKDGAEVTYDEDQ